MPTAVHPAEVSLSKKKHISSSSVYQAGEVTALKCRVRGPQKAVSELYSTMSVTPGNLIAVTMIYHREAVVFLDISEKIFSSLGVCMHGKNRSSVHPLSQAASCLTGMLHEDG